MIQLHDGTVIPSNLTTGPSLNARDILMQNYFLKLGVVTDIYYPDQDNNFSKKVIEYDVVVAEHYYHRGVTLTKYRNCKVNNPFGMSNNNLTYTLQADPSQSGGFPSQGSVVLVLCVNGRSDAGQAIILGGLSHQDGPVYTSEDGQFYDFNFNGINYNINNDGELTILFNSVVDPNGNKANPEASGTQIKIDKNGRIKISDNEGQYWELDRAAKTSTWSNGNDSIVIDKGNKEINFSSSGTMSSESQKAMSLSSQDSLDVSSKSDTTIASQSNMSLNSQSNMNQKVGGSWNLNISGNINATVGGNVSMQASGSVAINGTTVELANGATPVALLGSMSVGIGNLGSPVLSQIISNTATKVFGE